MQPADPLFLFSYQQKKTGFFTSHPVFFSFILSFNVYRKTFFTLPLPEFLLML